MPVHRSKDSKGPYYRWGESGKKYHYEAGNARSRERAKEKAEKQGRAARVADIAVDLLALRVTG
jgi:hypothetical protein